MPRRHHHSRPLPANDEENYVRRPSGIATDSYSNIPARLGTGAPNLTEAGQYPLVRLTENYPLILSLYRSSWIVRRVIDTISNDVYKSFPTLDTDLKPEELKVFDKVIKKTATVRKLRSAAKWGRLFGGAGAIMIIDGHDDLEQPLDLEDVQLGSYKGLIPLDRWSGIIPGPQINNDISDAESFGLPTFYNCIMDAGQVNIHHSRILRFTGRELPQWEVQVELYWGMSEIEVIFDELKKRDYSSWNIISLLSRAQVIAITDPQLATLMSGAGGTNQAYTNFINRMESMSQLMNNQGLMIMGKDGGLHQTAYGFGGIADTYHEFMKDLSAACEIPYEIIFGRESGLGSNAEGSLQLYDNLIAEKRQTEADPVIDKLIPVICMSTFGYVPDDIDHVWAPFRALSEEQRSNLSRGVADTVVGAYNSDLITKKEARLELRQASGTNGLFSNITIESIADTPDEFASEISMEQQTQQADIQFKQQMEQQVQQIQLQRQLGLPTSEEEEEGKEEKQPAGKESKAPTKEEQQDKKSAPKSKKHGDSAIDSVPGENAEGLLAWILNRINVFNIGR